MDRRDFRVVLAGCRRAARAPTADRARPRAWRWRAIAALLAGVWAVSCTPGRAPLTVAMMFTNSWRVGGELLTQAEQARLEQAAFDAMRAAFTGFDLVVAERPSDGARTIRVEDTPYGRRLDFGATGVTYPASRTSSVRFDVLANVELAVLHCRDISHCPGASRAALVEGLGRGVGATAAHELGHQSGFEFTHDSRCDDCYDGTASTSYAHFFGSKHWSAAALEIMRRTLHPTGP
ncbi:MAG TPA: hypothetical protein VKE51_09975 [Vicinamibacterales bacterium]|nr:hypothetical protein [Vicinamibacterales bacterium]